MIRNSRGIPAFNENAVLKLIIASGVGFVSYHLIRVILLVADASPGVFTTIFTDNLLLPQVGGFFAKFWTVLTYGWVHDGFWMLFSNMVWLYVFGSLVQSLVGHRQLIPMFIYCMLVGGLFYELAQMLPYDYFRGRATMAGAQGAIVGVSVAAIALAPGYRYYFTETFKVPLVVIAVVFYALQLMNANIQYEGAPMALLIGGAIMGYGYVILLKNGVNLSGWIYNITDKINNRFEPDERVNVNRASAKRGKTISLYDEQTNKKITQSRVDELLDKIGQKGYDALTKEEQEFLRKVSEEKDN